MSLTNRVNFKNCFSEIYKRMPLTTGVYSINYVNYIYIELGCFCLDETYDGKIYTFDVPVTINHPGHYIKHASKNNNLQIMKPISISSKDTTRLRIGFMAKRKIAIG